jgi:hypothetical protein
MAAQTYRRSVVMQEKSNQLAACYAKQLNPRNPKRNSGQHRPTHPLPVSCENIPFRIPFALTGPMLSLSLLCNRMKTDKPFLKSFISSLIFTVIMILMHRKEKMDLKTTLILWLMVLIWHLLAGTIVGLWAHKSKNPWSTLKIFGHVFYVSFLMAICLLILPLMLSLFS